MHLAPFAKRLWNRLLWIVPSDDVELDQRRRFLAMLLSVCLAMCGPIGLGLLPLALNPDSPASTDTFAAVAILIPAILLCYFFNRWSVRPWGSVLFLGASMTSTLWSGLEEPFILGFMSIQMLLAMSLLPLQQAVTVSIIGLCAHGLLLFGDVSWRELALPTVFNLSFLLVVITTQWHYRKWELYRLSQVEQSQQWFETTLSSIGDAVLTVDPERRVTFMNPIAEQLTGWTTDTALGKPIDQVFEIVNETTGEPVKNPVDEILLCGPRSTEKRRVELANHTLLLSKQGEHRPIADSAAPIVGPSRELWGAVLVFRDMTRELEVVAQLQHSQRLEALGQLAGGVAHDFNNLLTAIGGGLELAIATVEEGGEPRDDLATVRDATEQASGLTRQLLAFSRRQVMHVQPLRLEEAVERNGRLLKRLLRDDIVVKREVLGSCWVLVDPVQLDQVLVNLALNAGDAMPNGGTLTLETSCVRATHERPIASLVPGKYGRLRVSDTGKGIAAADRTRIFEPFFTTKEQDRGTGLGLATAYGIAQQSGGAITVDSTVGRGTTFDVFFPAAKDQSEAPEAPKPGQPQGKQTQTRRVLVVEDEPLVRSLMARVLTHAGHHVVEADCGPAAIAQLERGQTFDLLLTDIVMPEMKGTEVAAAFRQRFPDIPVLFTSGYADDTVAQTGLSGPKQSFIAKPFAPKDLVTAVSQALGAKGNEV